MSGYSVTNYNPYNVNNNFAFKGITTDTTSQIKNVPQLTQQPDTVSFSTKNKKESLSLGAKWAIGIGATTALAVGSDFLFCKGKHLKSIFGKACNKSGSGGTGKPNVNPTSTTHTTTSATPKPPTSTTTDVNVESATTTHARHRMTIGKVTNPYTGHRYRLYNRTPQDLKKECDAFKLATGAELHVPSTMASDLFGDACIVLERAAKDGNFPKNIKHVLVGHGYGSSVNGDWNIINGGGNVLNYIANNPNIKEGEKVLVLCCESYGTVRGRNGIGGKVILSLTDSLHPAKIVVKGQNKIGGELYFPRLLEDNTKPSVYMYSDKPAFTIKKK